MWVLGAGTCELARHYNGLNVQKYTGPYRYAKGTMRLIGSESDNRRDGVDWVTMPEARSAMESRGRRGTGSALAVGRFRVGTEACGVQEGRSQCHFNKP
jgi:hypothetical protein